MTSLFEFPGMLPADFFRFQAGFKKFHKKLSKEYLLPDTSSFLHEVHFADVFAGWSEEGLYFAIEAALKGPQAKIELFIDTRDGKTSAFNTRFCHHFLFLAQEERQEEITHFRSLEKRALCDPKLLHCERKKGRVSIHLPKEVLWGYDPLQFNRLGFNYRITAEEGFVQHFSASSVTFKVEEEPGLWASILLENK